MTSPSEEFKRLAYRREVLRTAIRLIVENYVGDDDVPPPEELICEDVAYKDRVVPPYSLHEVIQELREMEIQTENELKQYEIRKKDASEEKQRPSKGRRNKGR